MARLLAGDLIKAETVGNFNSAPMVVADPDRVHFLRTEWMNEFFKNVFKSGRSRFQLVQRPIWICLL